MTGQGEGGAVLGEEARERIGRALGEVLISLDPDADVFEWHHCNGCKQWLRGEPCPCAGAPYPAPALLDAAAALIAQARADGAAERCHSCDHMLDMHKNGGCWYTVSEGRVGENLVCPCTISVRNVL